MASANASSSTGRRYSPSGVAEDQALRDRRVYQVPSGASRGVASPHLTVAPAGSASSRSDRATRASAIPTATRSWRSALARVLAGHRGRGDAIASAQPAGPRPRRPGAGRRRAAVRADASCWRPGRMTSECSARAGAAAHGSNTSTGVASGCWSTDGASVRASCPSFCSPAVAPTVACGRRAAPASDSTPSAAVGCCGDRGARRCAWPQRRSAPRSDAARDFLARQPADERHATLPTVNPGRSDLSREAFSELRCVAYGRRRACVLCSESDVSTLPPHQATCDLLRRASGDPTLRTSAGRYECANPGSGEEEVACGGRRHPLSLRLVALDHSGATAQSDRSAVA